MATKRHREEFGAIERTDVVFECKTCNRKFPSFQALGGHRASHKRARTAGEEPVEGGRGDSKEKMHECGICGAEFSRGQALGGHMRRHRAAMNGGGIFPVPVTSKLPVSRRVVWLDLNLTPLENDLKLLFGNMAPRLDLVL